MRSFCSLLALSFPFLLYPTLLAGPWTFQSFLPPFPYPSHILCILLLATSCPLSIVQFLPPLPTPSNFQQRNPKSEPYKHSIIPLPPSIPFPQFLLAASCPLSLFVTNYPSLILPSRPTLLSFPSLRYLGPQPFNQSSPPSHTLPIITSCHLLSISSDPNLIPSLVFRRSLVVCGHHTPSSERETETIPDTRLAFLIPIPAQSSPAKPNSIHPIHEEKGRRKPNRKVTK